MKSPIYTIDEIHDLPQFGSDHGWFYGLIRYEGKIHFGEIYPGMGFSQAFDSYFLKSPTLWWWAIKDIYMATKY